MSRWLDAKECGWHHCPRSEKLGDKGQAHFNAWVQTESYDFFYACHHFYVSNSTRHTFPVIPYFSACDWNSWKIQRFLIGNIYDGVIRCQVLQITHEHMHSKDLKWLSHVTYQWAVQQRKRLACCWLGVDCFCCQGLLPNSPNFLYIFMKERKSWLVWNKDWEV